MKYSYFFCRYRDINEDVVVDVAEQEAKHLEKLKKKIAERKSAYATKKTSDVITLKPQKAAEKPKDNVELNKDEVAEPVQEIKTDSIATPVQNQDKKKAKPSHEFKVLGINDFEKKPKVWYHIFMLLRQL